MHAAALGGPLAVRAQVSGYRAIAQLVTFGAGIGLAPRSALEKDDRQHPAVPKLEEPWAIRHLQVCLREQALHSPLVAPLLAS